MILYTNAFLYFFKNNKIELLKYKTKSVYNKMETKLKLDSIKRKLN